MRTTPEKFLRRGLLLVALFIGGTGALACNRRALSPSGTGGNGVLAGGAGNTGAGGAAAAGGAAVPAAACTGASDARLVVADQRILRLTAVETINTVQYLTDSTEAQTLASAGILANLSPATRRFPPLQNELPFISDSTLPTTDAVAKHVSDYVGANFTPLAQTLVGCSATTDACANMYINRFAERAYRRKLTTAEQTRLSAFYDGLRTTQIVNGYQVTFTVEEATSYAVYAVMSSPQMLWRWELGDPAMASTSPAGIPLTDQELATHLAFFLTDQPPDQQLLDDAAAGTLSANLTTHVNRLLATQTAKDWLRTIMETWYLINQLPDVTYFIDRTKFPEFSPALVVDMATEADKFLDNALWNGNLTDLLLSRTTFLNANLATVIYKVPVPAGATTTNFVQTVLPADQRAGILTNAAFITRAARSLQGSLVARGRAIAATILCLPPLPPPPAITGPGGPEEKALAMLDRQTVQEQVAVRQSIPLCATCHAEFDPFGLALDHYDNIARYRVIDDRGGPVDAHTMLPASIGGDAVANAVDLAQKLATKPEFMNCIASTLLQYALVDLSARVEVPLLSRQQAGCATADLVQRYQNSNGRTFTDLVRATAAAPAFVLRRAAP